MRKELYRIEVPKDKSFDSTIPLLLEGYRFIANRRRKLRSDIFQTRIKGEKVICMSGPEAAKIFYDETRFVRKNAPPARVIKTLFGKKAVQTLDDTPHVHRKQLFMSLFTEKNINVLKEITRSEWLHRIDRWENMDKVILFEEAKKVMCKVACRWLEVPLKQSELEIRADDLWALVDSFGAVGFRHWRGRMARKKCNLWIEHLVKQVRTNKFHIDEDSLFYQMITYKELDGKIMDEQVVAVEVINILRPIVAISLYIVFGALALYTYPQTKEKLASGDDEYVRMFTQEVRRLYPFTPYVGARVRRPFIWDGHHFQRNDLVLLDIFGMNHDERIWEKPSEFMPERFKNFTAYKYVFIPQGGGDKTTDHRCAGETVTIAVMEETFSFLLKEISYDVPNQNCQYSMSRIPPKIKSGFIIQNVHKKAKELSELH